MDTKKLLVSCLLLAIGVIIAAHTAKGIHYDSNGALVVAVLLLSLCNLVLKPLLMLFSLPFIILTFGLGIWLINALLFMLVGAVVEGFYVLSFWNALWGAFVVSFTGLIANVFFGTKRIQVQAQGAPGTPRAQPQARKPLNDDDVIDI